MTHPPQQPLDELQALIAKLRSRIEQAFGSWTWRHGAAPNAKDDADAADTLERQAQEIQRLREALKSAALDLHEAAGRFAIHNKLDMLACSEATRSAARLADAALSSQENSDDR